MPTATAQRRWPRRLLIGLAGLALLLAAIYASLSLAFPPERLAALLSAQVTSATGRSFVVRGPLSIRLLPQPGIAAAEVSLGNAPWGTRPEMLGVKQARFNLALWPLLRGQLELASAGFEGVDLWLETNHNGVGNWIMGQPSKGTAAPQPDAEPRSGPGLRFDRLELRDAHLSYRDGRSGISRSASVEHLLLDAAGDGQRIDARFQSGTQRLQLAGQVGRLAMLTNDDSDWPFDLQLSGDGLNASAKGQLQRGAPPRTLQADVTLRLTQAQALAPWLGTMPALPLPTEAKGRMRVAGPALRIDALQLSLAQQSLNGQLSMQTAAPWKLDAQLNAASIDLNRWLPPRSSSSGAGGSEARRHVFGNQPLGLEALPQAQASLALRVERLLGAGLPPLSKLTLQLNLQPGRLRADPFSVGLAGGTLNVSLNASRSGAAPPRVNLRAQATNLSFDELLLATGSTGYARGGRLQLRADLDMAGNTPRALAAGANGELLLSINDTTLGQGVSPLGTDVLRKVLQALTLQPDLKLSSHIDCAVLRLPLKNGVAAIDRSIALETGQLAVSAKGQVRLDDETLTLAFTPTPKHGLNINPLNLARLVVLKGPWQDPQVQLDAQGVVGMAATLGLAGATGGASLIAQQLLQGKGETDACRVAMSARSSAAAPAPTAPASAALPAGLPQALPEALRRIFK